MSPRAGSKSGEFRGLSGRVVEGARQRIKGSARYEGFVEKQRDFTRSDLVRRR
jgi:hypothetical protein